MEMVSKDSNPGFSEDAFEGAFTHLQKTNKTM